MAVVEDGSCSREDVGCSEKSCICLSDGEGTPGSTSDASREDHGDELSDAKMD